MGMHKKCFLFFFSSTIFFFTNAQLIITATDQKNDSQYSKRNFAHVISVKEFNAKGDGVTNDSTAIQKAINAAAVYRGTVFIPNGIYNISGAVTVLPYVKLVGQSRDSTIIQTINPTNALLILTHTGVSNIQFRGLLKIVTPTIGINSGSAEYVKIEDNIIEYFSHGINTGGFSRHWDIQRNIVRFNRWDGIFIAAKSNYNHIQKNIVYGNGSNGIDVNGSFNIVEYNTVDSNGHAFAGLGYDGWGILVSAITTGLPGNANNNIVYGNWVRKSCMQNIIVRAAAGYSANFNKIINNTCLGSATGTDGNSDGICIDGSIGGELTGNQITGNTIIGQRRHGIYVATAIAVPNETIVSDNSVQNNAGYGLMLTGINTASQGNVYLYNMKGNLYNQTVNSKIGN